MADSGQKNVSRIERRRNVDRSAATRTQILDATVNALRQFGYGAVTNHIVAELAGVSRGAMIHHFPTRADLLSATAEYAYGKLKLYRTAQLEKIEPGLTRFRRLLPLAFETAASDVGLAGNEIRIGSRSDPEIARAIMPTMKEIGDDYGRFLGVQVREAGLESTTEMQGFLATVVMTARALTIDRSTYPRPEMISNVITALTLQREWIIERQLGRQAALTLEQVEQIGFKPALPN